ncbi:hypothetical protein [Bdellovibrio sp.]|uniref:hypothetical protein n=1 Tax=Bdellovibrio sp. TaxID=28201 RepID=UPI0039E439E6
MKAFLLTTLLLLSVHGQAKVWDATNTWSEAYEEQYSQWIKDTFKYDIFSNPSSAWYGIPTDCADAVYAARIIFAYENSLPVNFTNIENMRPNLSNEMTSWDSLSAKEKVRRFIRHVSDLTSTQTLGYDTYPVQISRETFRPGIIFVNPTLSREDENIVGTRGGHAETLIQIEENGFIRTLYSTTPSKVRDLITTRNPYSWPISRLGGFRAWKAARTPSLASPEQFEIAGWSPQIRPTRKQIYQWHETIRRQIRLRPPTIDERSDVVIESICNLWQGRVDAVTNAWKAIQNNGGRCLSTDLMDEHATTKRDARLREAYGQLNDLMFWRKNEYNIPDALGDIKDAKELLKRCPVLTGLRATDAWELFLKMIDNHLVSDSTWSPAVRWGETFKQRGQQCR